jgi:hypothetical protein
MCAYEFYWFDRTEKAHLVGILQEEREDPLSITRQSILDLGRKFVSDDVDVAHLYFIQVEV